jgi:hypothetical protein
MSKERPSKKVEKLVKDEHIIVPAYDMSFYKSELLLTPKRMRDWVETAPFGKILTKEDCEKQINELFENIQMGNIRAYLLQKNRKKDADSLLNEHDILCRWTEIEMICPGQKAMFPYLLRARVLKFVEILDEICKNLSNKADSSRDEQTAENLSQAEPEEVSNESKALALLAEHPDWTDKRIAQKIGIHRTSLYRYEKFKKVREIQKSEGKKNIPPGSKNPITGDIQAW